MLTYLVCALGLKGTDSGGEQLAMARQLGECARRVTLGSIRVLLQDER